MDGINTAAVSSAVRATVEKLHKRYKVSVVFSIWTVVGWLG